MRSFSSTYKNNTIDIPENKLHETVSKNTDSDNTNNGKKKSAQL